MAWLMPQLEVVFANLKESRRSFSLDYFRYYLKLPLHPNSRDHFTVVAPNGLFMTNWVIMGSTDAVASSQKVTEHVMDLVLTLNRTGLVGWYLVICGGWEAIAGCTWGSHAKMPGLAVKYIRCGKKISNEGISHYPSRGPGLWVCTSRQHRQNYNSFYVP